MRTKAGLEASGAAGDGARDAGPPRTRAESLVEVLHGVAVADPYRWLEDGDSGEVRAWTAAQNAYTERVLARLPGRERLAAELERLARVGHVEPPWVVGSGSGAPRYFHRRQRPEDEQPILYVRDGARGPDRVLLDPNPMSADGTTALDWWSPSPDGRLLAYGVSHGGDEQSTLRVLDVETGRDLPETEVISGARYASIAWLPDASGFYYSRFPERGSVPAGEERFHRRLYLHAIGRAPDLDPLVFGEGRAMTDSPSIALSPGGRWLVTSVHMGWSRREAYLRDREAGDDAPWIPLALPDGDAVYEVTPYDDHLLVRTNDGAPAYKLYRVDPLQPERSRWRELIAEGPDVLAGVVEVQGELFTAWIRDASSSIRRHRADGTLVAEVPLPSLGLCNAIVGEWDGAEVFFDFTSFAIPSQVWRLDLATGDLALWAEVAAPVDASAFLVEQIHVPSLDGTIVPAFVVRRRDVPLDGTAPLLLTAYGGFNISLLPQWSGARYILLERGAVIASANLRGGGELGEAWHRAGMLESKQNVFDDFLAVAAHLVASGATAADRLAIAGGSNGGLLVGAAVTQRPELFRAAVSSVPLLDMLRYHRFLIGKLWVPEYGSAEEAEQFAWLHAYSPYHRVVPGVRYPALLLCAAEGDSRVDPLHARKMAARLQAESGSDRAVLLRIESQAGHGAGKPTAKRIEEQVAVYAFLFQELGLTV